MDNEKTTELLMRLSTQISAIQKDVEYLKSEIQSNYTRSDENDSAVRELVEERTKWASNRQDAVKAEMQGQINVLKKQQELTEKQCEILDKRIKDLEERDSKKIVGRWEQIKDSLFKVGISFLGVSAIYYAFYLIKNTLTK